MSWRTTVFAIVVAVALAPAAVAQRITTEQVFALDFFDAGQKSAFEKGEVISSGVRELSDKELALIMAVLVPAPLAKVVAFSRSAESIQVNKDIVAWGRLDGDDIEGSLASAKYDSAEGAEIDKLLAVEPGSDFNLSAAEMASFANLRKKFDPECSQDAACAQAVMDAYRSVLASRVKAYQAGGLAAIEGYTRGSTSAVPAEELQKAAESLTLIKETYPEVYTALLNYPKGDHSKVQSTFLWFKQIVQDRPTFILSHDMLFQDEHLVIRIERQFYVGGSYNSLQIVIGLFPSGHKTTLFYLNRTSTDQVAGFMSGARHTMGRKMMEKEIRKLFDAALTAVSK